jgi:hypothetical protein
MHFNPIFYIFACPDIEIADKVNASTKKTPLPTIPKREIYWRCFVREMPFMLIDINLQLNMWSRLVNNFREQVYWCHISVKLKKGCPTTNIPYRVENDCSLPADMRLVVAGAYQVPFGSTKLLLFLYYANFFSAIAQSKRYVSSALVVFIRSRKAVINPLQHPQRM